jgi:hypothetical protein
MHEFWQWLFTNFVGHRLRFPTPTHTHIFSNHSSGYSCLNTTTCGVQRIAIKRNRKRFGFGLGFEQRWDYNFYFLLSFFDQVTWCHATRPSRPHQNRRKQPAIVDCMHTVAKALSTHVSIILIRVSVPAEDRSHQSSFFTHVHKGPVPKYWLMSYQLNTNNQKYP